MNAISLGIADGHRLFREGLTQNLRRQAPRIRITFEAENGRELLQKLDQVKPEVLLIEADLPKLNGFQAVEFIRKKHRNTRILVLSGKDDHPSILRMVDLGVKAYLDKNCTTQEVIAAIEQVARHN
jgi:DNA-binding NarL/FixJ family response regulator